jgi:hypothetical protein
MGWLWRTVPAAPISVCVYRKDFLFRVVDRWPSLPSGILAAAYLALFILPKLLLTFLAGTLISATLGQDFSADLSRFPLFRLALPISHASGENGAATIPYLRDYADLGICFFMATHMALLHKKWRHIGLLFTDLWDHNVISHKALRSGRYEWLLRRFDDIVNHRAVYIIPLCLSVASSVMFFWLFSSHGIYSSINPTGSSAWESAAFDAWWANPANGTFPFIFQFCWIVFILYYMFRHNVVGICAVVLVWKIVRSATRRPLLLPDIHHHDRFGGVGILKSVMIEVYSSVIIMGGSLLLTYYLLPRGALAWLVPFGLIFFVLNPFYILVPLGLVNHELRESKKALIQGVRQRMAKADRLAKGVIELELIRIEALPESLFSARRGVAFIVMYLIPVILFTEWVYGKVHR